MGVLIEGRWHDRWAYTPGERGEFVRPTPQFRERVSADGSTGFPAAAGRYHLYVSLACPWASRTLIARVLKRLEAVIGLSIVDPVMREGGWAFREGPGNVPDTVNGFAYLHQAYTTARPDYTGPVTVPVLWDRERRTIVNNESSEILRMLNEAFAAFADDTVDLYPEPLRAEIDAVNETVYRTVNNGVYRAGFAASQDAYDTAYEALFATLEALDDRLSRQRYLVGDRHTEADWRLFTTLVRFDAVYYVHFKCNRRRLVDFPHLWPYTRALYQVPGVAATVNLDHIKRHYYLSHPHINPSGIVPRGPDLDFSAPHARCA